MLAIDYDNEGNVRSLLVRHFWLSRITDQAPRLAFNVGATNIPSESVIRNRTIPQIWARTPFRLVSSHSLLLCAVRVHVPGVASILPRWRPIQVCMTICQGGTPSADEGEYEIHLLTVMSRLHMQWITLSET